MTDLILTAAIPFMPVNVLAPAAEAVRHTYAGAGTRCGAPAFGRGEVLLRTHSQKAALAASPVHTGNRLACSARMARARRRGSTRIVNSRPQPDWLIDRERLTGRSPTRTPEHAGPDIVNDGEIRRAVEVGDPKFLRANTDA